MEKTPTRNTEAYQLYLKGRYFWSKRTKESFEKSIEYFENAVEADPEYALAWSGLGDGYFYLTWWNWYEPGRKEGYEKAKEFALKALNLDNNLADAHVLLGNILFWHEWNWQEAEDELVKAISLNPNNSHAHWVYAELLDILCKREKAEDVNSYFKDPFVILGGTGRFEGASGSGFTDDYNRDSYPENSFHHWTGTITLVKGNK